MDDTKDGGDSKDKNKKNVYPLTGVAGSQGTPRSDNSRGKASKPGKKNTEDTPEPPKLTSGTKETKLMFFLFDGLLAPFMPKGTDASILPVKFYQEAPREIVRILRYEHLDENRTNATQISTEELMGMISKKLEQFAIEDSYAGIYCLSWRAIRPLAEKAIHMGPRVQQWPEPFGFLSEPGTALYRYDWDPVYSSTTADFPIFNGFLRRMKNAEAFCRILGSVFSRQPLRKYSIVMHGPTGTGKSKFAQMIRRMFPESVVGLVSNNVSDKGGCKFVENTILWFGDEVNPRLLATETYKELTGSDCYSLRVMYSDFYTVKLHGVFLLNCNSDRLSLPQDDAVLKNRIVPCPIHSSPEWEATPKIQGDDSKLMARVDKEIPAFAGYCINLFKENIHSELEYCAEELVDFVDSEDDVYSFLFSHSFQLDPLGDVPFDKDRHSITVDELARGYEQACREYQQISRRTTLKGLKKWLAVKMGVACFSKMTKTVYAGKSCSRRRQIIGVIPRQGPRSI